MFKFEGVRVACPQIERRRRAHKLSFKQRSLGGTSLNDDANDNDNSNGVVMVWVNCSRCFDRHRWHTQ